MVAWAFSLAAAGIFPALVLGVWWKRANKAGCVAGMTVGGRRSRLGGGGRGGGQDGHGDGAARLSSRRRAVARHAKLFGGKISDHIDLGTI